MPPSATRQHRRPPETDSPDTSMGFLTRKDRGQTPPPAPAPITATPEDDQFTPQIIQYLRLVVGPGIVRREEPYLKETELKKLGIRVAGLDLASGHALSSEPEHFKGQFLRPVPPSAVASCLGTRGLDNRDWLPENGGESWKDTNYGEACDILKFFDSLLVCDSETSDDGRDGGPLLVAYTSWRWLFPEMKNLSRKHPEISWEQLWAMGRVYRPFVDSPGSWGVQGLTLDPERPHIITTLAESHKILPDLALTSEVQINMLLACNYGAREPHRQHKRIPETVLTCSWRTCRVVQGIVNLRTRRVELRVSKNVEIEGGARKNPEKVLKLLGWLFAQPGGETMKD